MFSCFFIFFLGMGRGFLMFDEEDVLWVSQFFWFGQVTSRKASLIFGVSQGTSKGPSGRASVALSVAKRGEWGAPKIWSEAQFSSKSLIHFSIETYWNPWFLGGPAFFQKPLVKLSPISDNNKKPGEVRWFSERDLRGWWWSWDKKGLFSWNEKNWTNEEWIKEFSVCLRFFWGQKSMAAYDQLDLGLPYPRIWWLRQDLSPLAKSPKRLAQIGASHTGEDLLLMLWAIHVSCHVLKFQWFLYRLKELYLQNLASTNCPKQGILQWTDGKHANTHGFPEAEDMIAALGVLAKDADAATMDTMAPLWHKIYVPPQCWWMGWSWRIWTIKK